MISEQKAEKTSDKKEVSFKDHFETMFKKALEKINRLYEPGTIKHIKRYHGSLYEEIRQAENSISEVWEAGIKGNTAFGKFEEVLESWRLFLIRGIEIYKKESNRDKKLEKIL